MFHWFILPNGRNIRHALNWRVNATELKPTFCLLTTNRNWIHFTTAVNDSKIYVTAGLSEWNTARQSPNVLPATGFGQWAMPKLRIQNATVRAMLLQNQSFCKIFTVNWSSIPCFFSAVQRCVGELRCNASTWWTIHFIWQYQCCRALMFWYSKQATHVRKCNVTHLSLIADLCAQHRERRILQRHLLEISSQFEVHANNMHYTFIVSV